MKVNDTCALTTNEPEEGEIVDDCEDATRTEEQFELISSDEEAGMRERIRELEEKNAEIECITAISRSYDIERAARIPTDVSSISSTEFKTPKKRKRHKNKEHKKKSCHHRNHSHRSHVTNTSSQHSDKKTSRSRKTRCKRREKLLKKKHDKYAYKDFGDKLALESPDSFNSSFSSSPTDSDASVRLGNDGDLRDDDYYQTREIRDTLRLAVSRHRKNSTRQSKHKNGLKEKLMRRDTAFTGNLFSIPTEIEDVNEDGDVELIKDVYVYEDDGDAVEICEPDNDIHIVPDDSSDSLEEKELRLIALKSAVLKKHMERKRRNAEAAYSPTDFDEMMMHETKLADIDVVDLEEDDSQIAVGSPIASPQLMLLDGQDEESTQMVDCKPVDMDIANSDSESGMASNTWGFMGMSHSIPLPPLPPQSDMGLYSYVPGSGDLYLDEFPLNSINPPPPGVDDYEDVKLKQPLMTVEKYQENETEDMELENEFEPIVTYPTSTSQSADVIKNECSKSNSNDGASSTPIPPNDEDLQEEEEELALRALLLAKFQSPKNQKKNLASSVEAKEPAKDYKTNTELNIRVVKPTEAILKEAVKRLQIHSQLDTHQDNLQRKSPNSVQQPSSFAKEENDYHDIPLPWNPQRPIPIKNEKDCYHDADLLPWDPKHNSSDNFIPLSQDIKEEPKDFSSEALVSLQRKAKELKSNFEAKNVVRIPHDIGTTNDIPVETKETLNTNDTHTYQMPISMDEDIKRRLQKLKDEILSATRIKSIEMENSTHQTEYENNKPIQSPEQLRTIYPVLENTCCPRPEEIVNDSRKADVAKDIMHNTAESITATASMESSINHSDRLNDCIKNYLTSSEAEKPTCVKATTTPNSTKINIENSKDDIVQDITALKENNVNSVNKKNQTPITGIPNVNKVVLANKKLTKNVSIKVSTLSKTKATKSIPNKEVTSSSTVSQISSLPQITVTTTTSVTTNTTKPSTTLPSYSVLRTTKIVKPNKVINRNIDTKRKVILIKSEQTSAPTPAKHPKLEQSSTGSVLLPSKKIDTSRLITSMEQVKHMCNVAQLVISVQNSSNESSDEEWSNCDSMYRPLTEYNDIASPLSLHMESPCLTPLRSNSPVEMGENKEEKRNQRSPITAPARSNSPKTPKPIQTEKTASQTLNLKTPVAVRHLPAAAQDEYRKLIHRMKMLENQRNKKENISDQQSQFPTVNNESKVEQETSSTSGINKSSLMKKVLLRNANKPISSEDKDNNTSSESSSLLAPSKTNKANVLRSYESLYVKIGSGIVNNLDKSLRLVEEAKQAKVKKLKLEERLKELKAEMDRLQTQHNEEEQKIVQIYPTICSTNEIITSLKQKRSKVFKAAISLGKTLKGDEYRLNNDLKQNITCKTKLLAEEIKLVNSLKAANVHKLVAITTGSNPTEMQPKRKEISAEEKPNILRTEASIGEGDPPNNTLRENCEKTTTEPNEEKASDEFSTDLGATTESAEVQQFQENGAAVCDTNGMEGETTIVECKAPTGKETNYNEEISENFKVEEEDKDDSKNATKLLPSYISPLDHLRCTNDGSMDPNGVICPYDLMGNCEDVNCKYVHIAQKDKSESNPS